MKDWSIRGIGPTDYRQWILKKHYAKRVPQVQHAFGLFDEALSMQGVCTFGSPCRVMNNGECVFDGKYPVLTFELNRLCVNDMLPKNALSWFVGQCLRALPKPCCVVSYADANNGHHGYIYQATNWVYTGITAPELKYFNTRTSEELHPRTVVEMFGSRSINALPDWIERSKEAGGKYRYFQFLGDRRQIAAMRKALVYPVEPYPKGVNERYDASFIPMTQCNLF